MISTPLTRKKDLIPRIIIFSISTVLFLAGFVLNITSNQPLFNYNLEVVPDLQSNPSLGSQAFLTFMNIISNVFNPILCAGYIIIFFLISYRKLEILVFLIWFIFLSFLLSLLKEAVHQARPYWIAGSGVQMLEWTCYTEYGCPSGHSMLGIILIEFIIRFFARVNSCVSKYIGIFYFIGFIFELLVMFSRVILGMHSFNQVLFGLMIGLYTFVPYYLFIELWILKYCLTIFKSQKSVIILVTLLILMLISFGVEVLSTFLPQYNNQNYINVIETIEKCDNAKLYKSFQYKCFQDSALIMAAFGILTAFIYLPKPQNLAKLLNYSRISARFIAKFITTLVIALIPIAIFLNPLWERINTDTDGHAMITWACQIFGFFFGSFFLVYLAPLLGEKFQFEERIQPDGFLDFIRFESNYEEISKSHEERVIETQLADQKQEVMIN